MFRRSKQTVCWMILAVVIALFCGAEAMAKKPPKPPADEEPTAYTMVELPGTEGDANAVTQLDGFVEVVGRLFDSSGEETIGRAHHWMLNSAGDVLLSGDLQTLPPVVLGATVTSQAMEINADGVIVGYQTDGLGGPRRALLWPDAVSDPIELPTLGGMMASASSINDAGIVVGETYNSDGSENLVAWKVAIANGVAVVIETRVLLTADYVLVGEISNGGYLACSISDNDAGLDYRATRLRLAWNDLQVWEEPGTRTQLFDVFSQAFDVNEAGTVCGKCYELGAFAMDANGELLDLPTLPGGRLRGQRYDIVNRYANALNNASSPKVIGTANIVITETLDHRGTLPVLWNVGGVATDLSSVAVEQTPYPMDINDAGWIVGQTFELRQPVVLIPSR